MTFNKNFYKSYGFWLVVVILMVNLAASFIVTPPMYSIGWWLVIVIGVAAVIAIVYLGMRAVDEANHKKM